MKCKICNKRFELKKKNKYLAFENKGALSALTEPSKVYECFDCPSCGCQMFVNIRMPEYEGVANCDENQQ